jgi:hypothetical protein
MEKAKQILEEKGIDSAVAYLCIVCNVAPIDAKEIVYNLI